MSYNLRVGPAGRPLISLVALVAMAGTAQAAAPADTLAKVKATQSITLGVRSNAAPFASMDASGKPQGFTWELCKAIVKSLSDDLKTNIDIKVVPTTQPDASQLLESGEIDLQCGSTTHTLEREHRAGFSNTFFHLRHHCRSPQG